MRFAELSLFIKFLASASCMAWISAVPLSLIYLLHLSPLAGWAIVGIVSFAAVIPITWFRLEMEHALDLADYPDSRLETETVGEEDFSIPAEPPGDIGIF
jgi:hypothetical protein